MIILMKKKTLILGIISMMLTVIGIMVIYINVYAAYTNYKPSPILYENPKEIGFSNISGQTSSFSCGSRAGELVLRGNIEKQGYKSGVTAYSATGEIVIAYDYAGLYQSENVDEWNLVDSDSKNFDGHDIKKVEKGTIVSTVKR